MLFASTVFLFVFLPICLLLYYIFRKNTTIKNLILLFASLGFYAYGEPKLVLLMCFSIVLNWIFALCVENSNNIVHKKIILTISVICNLSGIIIFKYLMFVMGIINALTPLSLEIPVIRLPIGISFYTFQALSYVVDVYRGNGKAQKSVFNVALYIAFFPQLIAGPIVRYETIALQINNRTETFDKFCKGVCRFIAGLTKKVLMANTMAAIADSAFDYVGDISVSLAWLGAVAYSLQIYYDFSGYSDMAIGLGKMFGFEFLENFDYPYISKSITEFWRRWHISLGTWFRDYVYFPMGGSRVSKKSRLILNLLTVWFLTGLWHGASMNFILWGLYFFVFLVMEKMFFSNYIKQDGKHNIFLNIISHFYALFVVLFGWVLFRAKDLNSVSEYLCGMFGCNGGGFVDDIFMQHISKSGMFIILGVIFALPLCRKVNEYLDCKTNKNATVLNGIREVIYPFVMLVLLVTSVAYLLKGMYNPFIYFNF